LPHRWRRNLPSAGPMWRSLSLPPVEKAVPDQEVPTKVGASWFDRYAGLHRRMVVLDQSAEIQRSAGFGVGRPPARRSGRTAARVLVAGVASARWSGTPWIVRRRRARPAQLGCSFLSCAAPGDAWPGSASASAVYLAADPLPWRLHSFRVRILIRSDSNSATIANTLNSSRPTGSVGS